MRRFLMLAVMGAGLAFFGSEKTAKADHCVGGGFGYNSFGVYNGGFAPYGGGFVSGYTFNRAPAFYGNYGYVNPGYGFYNRPGVAISIGVNRGFRGRGFGRGGFRRGGFGRGGFGRW